MAVMVFFLFFLLASSHPISVTELTLSSNQTLVSAGQNFELGLFKPGSKDRWYMGIWYKEDPNRTNVWVGNRDVPLTTPVGTFRFDVSNLSLFDQNNVPVWTIIVADKSLLTSPVTAELLDNGNFVIKESNDPGRNLWQSFDHPSNTLVPEMRLKISYSSLDQDDLLIKLYSQKSSDDPSKGSFLFRIGREEEVLATYISDQRMDTWNGYQFGDMPPIFELKEGYFVMKTLPNDSSYLRFTMEQTGDYELYSWNSKAKEWKLFWSIKEHYCKPEEREYCGSFSFCYEQTCNCIKEFVQKLEHSSNGCQRRTRVKCSDDEFVKLQNMKLPRVSSSGFSEYNPDCKQSCLRDCECNAFAVVEVHKGEHRCMLWGGEIDDMRNYTFGGQDLYVKVAAKDLGEEDNDTKSLDAWIIGLIVAATICGFCIIGFIIFSLWKKVFNSPEGPISEAIMTEIAGSIDRFQFMEFETVAEATNNFSEDNKIGEGGFGAVYKGILPNGLEIAVKRLANTSSQGIREFQAEVSMIINIIHINLVRLQGCCCERGEIILIYEFLSNSSLNQFIFDASRNSLLNWNKRHAIIKGIAEGLLYLHSYINPPIIHRDLKPSNILLDDNLIPKISDFGLAKILQTNRTQTQMESAVGTRGYMSEEYVRDMNMSEKSDIFSFGVTVIEILTGEKNYEYCNLNPGDSLLDKAWRYWNEGNWIQLVDSNYIDSTLVEDEVKRSLQVALLCVQANMEDRPSTKSVAIMLERSELEIPKPKVPNYFYAKMLCKMLCGESSSLAATASLTTTITTVGDITAVGGR